MNQVKRWLVWLSRIHRCWGFGIQSPTDYWFVRNVVNEHWPYYAYDELREKNWLRNKLGQLFLRLANWRQPSTMVADEWQSYWKAGCRKTRFQHHVSKVELAYVEVSSKEDWEQLLPLCDKLSVLVVGSIWQDRLRWHEIEQDERVGTTFDLYYCGIVLFDNERFKHNYIINF